jgi:hypothetical protein
MAAITYSDFLGDTKVGQCHGLCRTCLVEDLAAISAVVFAIREGKGCSTTKAHLRINPFGRRLGVHHGRIRNYEIFGRELVT